MPFDAYPNPPNDPASFAAYGSGQSAPGVNYAGLLQAMAQANDFTLEELQMNRQGVFSQRQRAGESRSGIGCVAIIFLFTISILVPVGVPLAQVVGPLPVLLVAAGVLAVVGWASFSIISGNRKQLREARVLFVDGFVERERHESYDSANHVHHTHYSYVVYQQQQYAVNQQRFSVSGAAFHALVPGLRYRIYYLSSDGKLLSIEPLA